MADPDAYLDIETRTEAGAVVIDARGEVDMASASALADHLEAAAGASGPVVVDLCGTSFMDSSGLNVLIRGAQRLAAQGRRIVLACEPAGQVEGLLDLTRVRDTVLPTFASRAAALDAVRG
jgi:anti-sigma B factor antagonist